MAGNTLSQLAKCIQIQAGTEEVPWLTLRTGMSSKMLRETLNVVFSVNTRPTNNRT